MHPASDKSSPEQSRASSLTGRQMLPCPRSNSSSLTVPCTINAMRLYGYSASISLAPLRGRTGNFSCLVQLLSLWRLPGTPPRAVFSRTVIFAPPRALRNGDRRCRGIFLTFPSYVVRRSFVPDLFPSAAPPDVLARPTGTICHVKACLERRLWGGTRQRVYMNLQCPEVPAQPKPAFSLELAASSSFRMFRDPTLCEHKARNLQPNDVDTSFDKVASTFRASRRVQTSKTSSVPLAVTAMVLRHLLR
ncbi:hypothetical protein IW262DRAFT_1382379 [Armillaria fumosa]|nr:hypothetical protein IW262DRAFT_1382379 [Armillaria fumosa]